MDALLSDQYLWRAHEKALLRYLANLADPTTRRIERQSVPDLLAALGVSKATLSRLLNVVERAGVVTRETADGVNEITVYALHLDALASWTGKSRPREWRNPVATSPSAHAVKTRIGVRRAMERGVRFGRQRAAIDLGKLNDLRAAGKTMNEIANALGVSVGTLYRELRKIEGAPPTPPAVDGGSTDPDVAALQSITNKVDAPVPRRPMRRSKPTAPPAPPAPEPTNADLLYDALTGYGNCPHTQARRILKRLGARLETDTLENLTRDAFAMLAPDVKRTP